MSLSAIVSHLVTFLVGIAIGTAGKYMADKYTDKRRLQEQRHEANKTFKNIRSKMPELIAEMKEDLSKEGNEFGRIFYILKNDRILYNLEDKGFLYYEDQHKNLKNKIRVLENHGYIYDIAVGNTPKFQMTEEFVRFVLNS